MPCKVNPFVSRKGEEMLEAGVLPSSEEPESLSSLDSESLDRSPFLDRGSGAGPTGHCNSLASPTTSAVSRTRRMPSTTECSDLASLRGAKFGRGGVTSLKNDFRRLGVSGAALTVLARARRLGVDLAVRRRWREGKFRRLGLGGVSWGGGSWDRRRLGRRAS